ncbi:MAG: alpha/beta fold hydrolase [Thermodesulfobacteriota bacterium]
MAPFLRDRSIPLVRPARIDWNPSLSPRILQVRGHTIFYVVKGEGEPLLLIHGYGAGCWVWEKQIDVLARDYRVYAVDILGYGYSDRPKIEYSPETYIQFLRDFMDGLAIERATLIGNSMGGGIVWAVAALFPERVKKLVLIDCVPPDVLNQVRNQSFRTLAIVKNIPFLLYLVIASRSKRSVRAVLEECLFDRRLITAELVNRQYELTRFKGSTWVLYSTLRHASETSKMWDYLSLINHPTLLVWGEGDLVFPPTVGKSLREAIRGSKLHIIKKSGHIPMWETPDEVNRVILDFLKEAT